MPRVIKFPLRGTEESRQWCEAWDKATHYEKLRMCQAAKARYQSGKDYRASCRLDDYPPDYKFPKSAKWAEQIKVIQQMDDLIAYHQKVPSELTITLPTERPLGITWTADWHLGMFGVDYDSFMEDMNLIETEDGLYCFPGGDGYQNIIQPTKIGSSHNQTPISVQKGLYVLTLKKLKEKILAIGTGNHNYWTAMAEGEDWDAELSHRLKLIYTKHAARINLKVGNQLYPILRMHKGRFNSSFNLTHTCKQYQRLNFPEARIIVVEHQHIAAIEQYRYNENECVAIRTGTYAIYDDYAQQAGFFGAHVANPTVILYPNEDRMVAFKDMSEAVIYLRAVRK